MRESLSKKQRRFLQIAVGIIVLIFIIGFILLTHKSEPSPTLKNGTVYVQDSNLQVFDDSYSLAQFPDRVSLHYPYILVIKPAIQTTYVYNIEQKKKENEVKEVLLDYSNGHQLYTIGKTTFLDNQDLGVLCDKGFIKNSEEILCLSAYDVNAVQNELVSINPNTKTKKYIYRSQGILSDVKVINNQTYLGELDTYTNKSRILIDQNPIDVPTIVNTIYQMDGQPYYASFKSVLNQNTESYYLIESNKVTKQEVNRIYLYK